MAVSVALATLGCKVNQAEAEELRQELEARGYRVTEGTEDAELYVINTCTVTHIADRKSRNLVQRACRANPQAKVLVTGCYAQRGDREMEALPQVRLVPKGTAEELASQVEQLSIPDSRLPTLDSRLSPRRSRAMVKAQDGCDQHCTYCAVPLARGRSRSLPVEDVVRKVRDAVAAGHREVVLTGVNLSYYGNEWDGSLLELLDHVLEAGPERLRLSSLQPQAVSDSLLERWQDRRLCRHFHLAIQSGSDSVLKRMGRRYGTAEFRAAVDRIRQAVPGASITTDAMVGFPGETQQEFGESYDFCREIGFARMHVFQFSPRAGTAAARLPGDVPARVRADRSRQMLSLAVETSRAFRETFLGSTVEVLFEEEVKGRAGCWRGLTDNYLEVEVESRQPLAQEILPARLQALYGDILSGSVDLNGSSH